MNDQKLSKVMAEFHFPTDLWPEVLSKLPVKSLLRFCCVSKLWLALIHGSDFARLHLKNFKNNRLETNLFVVNGREQSCSVRCSNTFKVNVTVPSTLRPADITGSWVVGFAIDGLVLLQSWISQRWIANTPIHSGLLVWNPSIRKSHEVPAITDLEICSRKCTRPVMLGLGYDPLVDDYKLVQLIFVEELGDVTDVAFIAVYNLGAGAWKIIQLKGKAFSNWEFYSISYDMRRKIYFRGSLYFTAVDRNSHVLKLVSFDLSSEVLSSISFPVPAPRSFVELALVDGGSSLAVFGRKDEDVVSSLWVLETESLCWTKRYSFSVLLHEYICFKKNGDLLCRCPFLMADTNRLFELVVLYNLETEEIQTMLQNQQDTSNISDVFGYVESLVLLR